MLAAHVFLCAAFLWAGFSERHAWNKQRNHFWKLGFKLSFIFDLAPINLDHEFLQAKQLLRFIGKVGQSRYVKPISSYDTCYAGANSVPANGQKIRSGFHHT